ncbi:hypothetical protein HY489_01915 [Candidatus Woesearchaeota archaeon]|nr:hypothetical protein [Candidatus Woesearchaeota archaeon]
MPEELDELVDWLVDDFREKRALELAREIADTLWTYLVVPGHMRNGSIEPLMERFGLLRDGQVTALGRSHYEKLEKTGYFDTSRDPLVEE